MTTSTYRRSDVDLARDVIAEIDWDPRLDGFDIQVDVADGIVTLTGVVDSWARRRAAEVAVRRVVDALSLADDLAVVPPPQGGRSDTDIARAVRHALEWDVLVPHEQIRITVSDGVVTLEGHMAHWADKDAALLAIENLAGVRRLLDLITVEASVSPKDARRTVIKALARHAVREARHLVISIREGEITVAGEVGSVDEREVVKGALRGLPGITDVRDMMTLARGPGRPHPMAPLDVVDAR